MWLPFFVAALGPVAHAWTYANDGIATMTHYTMSLGTIASCGCTGGSTYYPTAALSSLAYGSDGTVGFGPGCGRCFNLTLLNTFLSTPPFYPNPTKSIVVKVTDHVSWVFGWVLATETSLGSVLQALRGAAQQSPSQMSEGGAWLNFDLVWPSRAIPDDWFPSNESFYGKSILFLAYHFIPLTFALGYADFGVWNISYQSVSCVDNWAGGNDPAALGSVNNLGSSVCCPADPLAPNGTICPSTGNAPDTGTSGASRLVPELAVALLVGSIQLAILGLS